MGVAILSLWLVYKNYSKLSWAIPTYAIINIYMLCSWNAWWFGGSYGNRGYVESYAVMLIPLAAFVTWSIRQKWIIKLPAIALLLTFCSLNVFQTWQMNNGILDPNYMTKNYYWAVFGKTSTSPELNKQRALQRGAKFTNKEEYQFLFEKDLTPLYTPEKLQGFKP